jgi:hypothetical protein
MDERGADPMNKDETALSYDNARLRAELAEMTEIWQAALVDLMAARAAAAVLIQVAEDGYCWYMTDLDDEPCGKCSACKARTTPHPGTALLAEITAARKVVEAADLIIADARMYRKYTFSEHFCELFRQELFGYDAARTAYDAIVKECPDAR